MTKILTVFPKNIAYKAMIWDGDKQALKAFVPHQDRMFSPNRISYEMVKLDRRHTEECLYINGRKVAIGEVIIINCYELISILNPFVFENLYDENVDIKDDILKKTYYEVV